MFPQRFPLVAVLIAAMFGPSGHLAAQEFKQEKPSAELGKAFKCGEPVTLKSGNALLTKVQQRYRGVHGLHGAFRQESYVAALDTAEQSAGDVVFSKPGRMKWHYRTPEEQIFVIKDKTLWLYQAAERQVVVDDASRMFLSELPVSFLMGVGDLTASFELSSACQTSHGVLLSMLPRARSKGADTRQQSLEKFEMLVDQKSFLPAGARVTDVGGNITAIELAKVEPLTLVDEGEFVTVFPDGTDINDRRSAAGQG